MSPSEIRGAVPGCPLTLPSGLRRFTWCLRKREGAGEGGEACEQHYHITPCRNEIMHIGVERVVAGAGQHGEPPGELRGRGCNADAHPARTSHVEKSSRLPGQAC